MLYELLWEVLTTHSENLQSKHLLTEALKLSQKILIIHMLTHLHILSVLVRPVHLPLESDWLVESSAGLITIPFTQHPALGKPSFLWGRYGARSLRCQSGDKLTGTSVNPNRRIFPFFKNLFICHPILWFVCLLHFSALKLEWPFSRGILFNIYMVTHNYSTISLSLLVGLLMESFLFKEKH